MVERNSSYGSNFIKLAGDIIGRILIVEFNEIEYPIYNKIVEFLNSYSTFTLSHLNDEIVLKFSELTIYHNQRKVYCNNKEIKFTAKEYNLLFFLASNKGRVLTYSQIYQNVWENDAVGNEKNTICCHVHKIKKKFFSAAPNAKFSIQCVREVGYCFNEDSK